MWHPITVLLVRYGIVAARSAGHRQLDSILSWKVTVWGLSQLVASTVTSSVLCGLLYACVVRWSCCVTACWLERESGENKTVPQHPPSRERTWTKGVGDCNE